MAATVQSVRDLDLGGAFSALTEAQIQTYLDLAARMIDASVWGDCYDQAHALLGAHLVQEATQAATGAVGPVTSASAGGLSVSYGGGGISGAVSGTRFAEMLNDLWDACGGVSSAVVATGHSCDESSFPMFFAAAGSTSAPSSGGFTDAYKTKLDGIADGATANASDADLRDRATHTGTQTAATISDFAASVDARLGGFAPLASPTFTGTVTAPNPPSGSSDQTVATTSWVRSVATGGGGGSVDLGPLTNRVTTLEASQTAQNTDIAARAPLASPALTGVPTAPTASTGTSTTQVATTAFVAAAIPAPVDLAPLTGRVSTAETMITALETSQGAQDTTIAAAQAKADSNEAAIASKAPLASPALTGSPTAPTPAASSDGTEIATTAFVVSKIPAAVDLGPLTTRVTTLETSQGTQDTAITAAQAKADANETALSAKAPLASPTFTGVPKGPTASPGENTTQLATTAFVTNAVAGVSGGGAPLASPVFTGNPRAPTPATGDNDTSIATTQFVKNVLPDVSGIATNAAAISALQAGQGAQDTAIAAKADTASPTLTGAPKAPTPAGTATGTEIATAAFVLSKIPAATDLGPLTARVDALETSQGTQDTAIAARAPLASPALTGNPTAPTQTSGNNSTRLATTAFVQAALPDTSGIATNANAISTIQTEQTTQNTAITAAQTKADANETALAQKASIASPTFTGVPRAPTPANSSNDTTIATTAFVKANAGSGGGSGPAPDPFPYWNRFTVFSTPGNASWTAPAGVTEAVVILVGGGGGGGGGCNVASGTTGAGGGGGGSSSVQIGKVAVTPGTSYPLVIANGGTGGAGATDAKAADGAVGGNSTGFSLTATGGNGGVGGNTTAAGTGGTGGTVSGGDQTASDELKTRGTVAHLDGQYVPSVQNTVLSAQTPHWAYTGFCRDGQDGGQGGLPALTRGNGRNGGDGGKGQLQQAGGGAGGFGGGGGGRSNGAGGGGGWGSMCWGGNGSRGATSQGLLYFFGYGGGGGGGQPGGGNPDLRFERQNAGTGNYSMELAFNTGSGLVSAPGAGNGGGGGGGPGGGGGGGTGALAGAANAGGNGAAGRIVILWHA